MNAVEAQDVGSERAQTCKDARIAADAAGVLGEATVTDAAGCSRSTVALCLRALEWCGLLTWAHRIDRVRESCTDLFGRQSWRWKVVRRSNCYLLRDPVRFESDSRAGTRTSFKTSSESAPARELVSPLADALTSLRAAIGAREGIEQDGRGVASVPGAAA